MSKKQKRFGLPILLVVGLAASALGFMSNRSVPISYTTGRKATTSRPGVSANANEASHVKGSLLRPQLIANLDALGDRLLRPGKERLTVTGTLSLADDAQPGHFVAVLEFPDKLHLTIARGVKTSVIAFDGQHPARAAGRSPDSQELDFVETLIHDAADHFFSTQMQGRATRALGNRFRMDDGSTTNYSGPYYDIYQVADSIRTSSESERRSKLYYFNSDTLLLERVRYQINREGSDIKVEEVIGDWQKEQGQQIARRIERFENEKSVFVFTVRTVTLSPHVDDGIFASGQ
jgi:hypothetical protein